MVNTDPNSAYPIRAVARVCDILDLLQENPDGVILTDVASRTGMPKSSAFRYLAALEDRQYAEREAESGHYRLGLAFRPMDTRRIDQLAEVARPQLERLRIATGETTNLGLLTGGRIVHVDVLESPQIMRLAARIGETLPIHVTALGKAIAATINESRLRSILHSEGMPMVGPLTITDPDKFMAHLDVVREQGYGVDDCEAQHAGRCVAVALDGVGVPAAISVSAPSSRLAAKDIPQVATRLKSTARAINKSYLKLFG